MFVRINLVIRTLQCRFLLINDNTPLQIYEKEM